MLSEADLAPVERGVKLTLMVQLASTASGAPQVLVLANEAGFAPVSPSDLVTCTASRSPPEDPAMLLEFFDFGLTTQEVAALLTHGNDQPDRADAEDALLELVHDGRAQRDALGDDALWTAAQRTAHEPSIAHAASRRSPSYTQEA